MNDQDASSVWNQYRAAKKHAAEEAGEKQPENRKPDDEMSLEELERAIAELAAASGVPETGMPPRAAVHESPRGQLTRWFYRVLLVLFIGLVAGLVWWGRQLYSS